MAAIADSRGTYSWWWDSHITPKNSKWLQENLSDMDDKVLDMLKLIEEDGDSFARRAEMFYQRRPKLLELIEQFHRAYRALAERYDHASGVLRQAHNSVSEAVPDTSEFDVGKFISTRITDLQEHVLMADAEIETLRLNLDQVESERDAAIEELAEIKEEKEAFAVQCRENSVRISELNTELEISNTKSGLLEKSNRELRLELDESVRKMGDQSEELIEKIKELGRVWQEHLRSEDVEAALEKIHDFRSEIRRKDRELAEKVEELNSVSIVSSRLKDENLRLRDIAKQLKVDIERQVNHQNELHREIDRLKNEIEGVKFEANEKVEVSRNRSEASWLLLMFSQLILIAERESSEKRYQESEAEREKLVTENARLRLELDEERKQYSVRLSAAENRVEQLQRDLEETNSSIEISRASENQVRDMEFEILESTIESSILYTVFRQMDVEVTKITTEREKHVSSLVGSVVASNIRENLLEDRICDLTEAKDREIEGLKKRVEFLEGENVELASLLATTYRTTVETSVRECEKESPRVDYLEIKVPHYSDNLSIKLPQYPESEFRSPVFQDIKQITNVQIESPLPINTRESKSDKPREDEDEETRPLLRKETKNRSVRQNKPTRRRQLSQGDSDTFVTKDIVLDRNMSERSSRADDRILEELWEAADVSSSINLKVGGIRSRSHSRVASSHRSKESLSLTEKELGVDGEIEKVLEPSRRRSSRRVLDRLNTDLQKLTNLQITVQDLRRKVEMTDQRAEEYDNVKEQLEETEVAIMNFFDTNQKLTKSMQKLEKSKEGGESVRRVSEQARRVSEEIGRLQVELQRIQWLLVKLDEEDKKEKRRGGSRPLVPAERKSTNKIVLKDILHVKMKKSMKKKKGQFCGCVQPPSRSE